MKFSAQPLRSLRLCGKNMFTAEAQRTQRLRREKLETLNVDSGFLSHTLLSQTLNQFLYQLNISRVGLHL